MASETLPIRKRSRELRPWDPRTIKSACHSSAASMIRDFGSPCATAEVTFMMWGRRGRRLLPPRLVHARFLFPRLLPGRGQVLPFREKRGGTEARRYAKRELRCPWYEPVRGRPEWRLGRILNHRWPAKSS